MTDSEIRRLLLAPHAAGRTRDYLLLSLAYYLGLRVGEAVTMRSSLIRVADRVVLVPTEKRKPRRGDETDPHTGRLVLPVPILIGERVITEARRWGSQRTWLFRGAKGGHLTARAARAVFRSWAEAVGLHPETSFHALRHTAGTRLWEATKDPVLVRDFMRHADVATTDIYLHATPQRWDAAREAMRQTSRRS